MAVHKIKSKVWKYPGMAGWYFLSVDKATSTKIKKIRADVPRRGWGSVPVTAKIGKTTWQSSIFPDAKSGTFLLPLKAAIRKKEDIYEDDVVNYAITIRAK